MKYLFVVGHPAHVHLFKNVIRRLIEHGHEVLVGAVAREVTVHLLRAYGLRNFTFGRTRRDLLSKGLDVLPKDIHLVRKTKDFDPDAIISTGSPYAAHASAIRSRPHIVFADTENATLVTSLMLPFSDAVFTPVAFKGDLGPKHLRYNGYKELAYLRPEYFQPDPRVLSIAGLTRDERFILMRFAAWDASHDLGDSGFSFPNTESLESFVRELEQYGKVLVTSDAAPPASLEDHQVDVNPERMHDLLAFASLYIGEGATMAAEAGVLGVPWIFVSTTGRGFLDEQQSQYSLGFWETSARASLKRARRILSDRQVPEAWRHNRERLLRDKIDVTSFMLKVIEHWPENGPGGARAWRPLNSAPPG